MPKVDVAKMTRENYDRAAQEYLASLPLEHFAQAETQGRQRAITLCSFRLLQLRRPDCYLFNEMLVQYPFNGELGQVVPDNMVILGGSGPGQRGSYNLPFEDVRPFWVLDYVSRLSKRKDYADNFNKYERQLQVLYCLSIQIEAEDMRLYRHDGERYQVVKPDARGLSCVPELDLHVGLIRGWVRYWYQEEMLLMPGELQQLSDRHSEQIEALRAELRALGMEPAA